MRPLVLALSGLFALGLVTASVDAHACRRPPGGNVVGVRDDALIRAAQLDREARTLDSQATMHMSRAQNARSTAAALEEAVPASFGEAREVILARIDSLLEMAASEAGEARMLRVRASELRAQAQRLRNQNGGGGGWRGRGVPERSSAAIEI